VIAEARERRQAERAACLAEQARLVPGDRVLAAIHEWVQLLVKATLLGEYHWHRGEWRRRRKRHEETKQRREDEDRPAKRPGGAILPVPKKPLV
jgi:hypothetical protein